MSLPTRSGRIVTFYSYKGGTGRSMALANVAWVLAAAGKKVLIVDWDLEAPGVHRYFQPFLADKELANADGVIEFTMAALDPGNRERGKDWYLPYANILRFAQSLRHPFPEQGRLDFIGAGRQTPEYASRVNCFDWHDFYDRVGGGVLLEAARKEMRAEYDYVLIDSRTGVSDTSGITTVQMPDDVVVCFTLNNQGIEGASGIAESVSAQARARGVQTRIFPVPMRVDPFEKSKLDVRKALARVRFAPFPEHLSEKDRETNRNTVQFNYVPYYAYEEILAAFGNHAGEAGTLLAATL